MSRFDPIRKENSRKRDETSGEEFSLKGTLKDYEVEELDAHQAARLVARLRPGTGSRRQSPSLRLVRTGMRL